MKGLEKLLVVLVIVVGVLALPSGDLVAQCEFVRGDIVDLGDEGSTCSVDANDLVAMLAFLFLAPLNTLPLCPDAADFNDNGFVELSDFLFLGNQILDPGCVVLAAPYPDPGVDPTPGTTVPDERDTRFSYKLGSSVGFPSNTGLEIPIFLSNEQEIHGFQMVMEYDGSLLRIDEIRLDETVLAEESEKSYIIAQFFNQDGVAYAGLSALLNWDLPLTFKGIPPGDDHVVGRMVLGIFADASPNQTTKIEFTDGVVFPDVTGTVPDDQQAVVDNFVVIGSGVIRPVLDDESDPGGIVEITTAFIRGNVNMDRSVNIADPVFLLNWIFGVPPGTAPSCLDAADANNDSKTNIADGVFLLNYFFLGFAQPPAPFPLPGLDPEAGTSDSLGCDV